MRIRTLKPEFWTHPVMGKLDDSAKLLSLGLLNYSDDEGYFYADPSLIRAAIRPFDDCSTIVRRSIEQLKKTGFLAIVEHPTHGLIGRIVSFSDHQKIDRAKDSKIKELYDSASDRRIIDDDSLLEGKGTGNREQGTGNAASDDAVELFAEEGRPESPRQPLPENWKKLKPAERQRVKVNFNSPLMLKVGELLGRRQTTFWNVEEAIALGQVNPSEEDIEEMLPFYSAIMPPGQDFRRREIITLLNNWNGELDKARAWNASQPKVA